MMASMEKLVGLVYAFTSEEDEIHFQNLASAATDLAKQAKALAVTFYGI